MKKLRNAVIATAGLTALNVNNVLADFAVDTGNANEITVTDNLTSVVNRWLGVLLNFLYIVAVLYGIYGGFLILTAAGDDEKVGKGKKVIINAILGLVVIFIVGAVMRFVIDLLLGGTPA